MARICVPSNINAPGSFQYKEEAMRHVHNYTLEMYNMQHFIHIFVYFAHRYYIFMHFFVLAFA